MNKHLVGTGHKLSVLAYDGVRAGYIFLTDMCNIWDFFSILNLLGTSDFFSILNLTPCICVFESYHVIINDISKIEQNGFWYDSQLDKHDANCLSTSGS